MLTIYRTKRIDISEKYRFMYDVSLIQKGPPCCNLLCESCVACVHMYRCTCVDNVMRFNLCQYIHACCQSSKSDLGTVPIASNNCSDSIEEFPSLEKCMNTSTSASSISSDIVFKCDLIKTNIKQASSQKHVRRKF